MYVGCFLAIYSLSKGFTHPLWLILALTGLMAPMVEMCH